MYMYFQPFSNIHFVNTYKYPPPPPTGVSLTMYDQTANEWQRVINDEIACVLVTCLRLDPRCVSDLSYLSDNQLVSMYLVEPLIYLSLPSPYLSVSLFLARARALFLWLWLSLALALAPTPPHPFLSRFLAPSLSLTPSHTHKDSLSLSVPLSLTLSVFLFIHLSTCLCFFMYAYAGVYICYTSVHFQTYMCVSVYVEQ